MNYVQIAKDIRAAAKSCIEDCRREDSQYYVHREVEILALDAAGERCGLGEPYWLPLRDCSGKSVRAAVESVIRDEPEAVAIGFCGGTDAYESMDDMMKGYDYTPWASTWDLEDVEKGELE